MPTHSSGKGLPRWGPAATSGRGEERESRFMVMAPYANKLHIMKKNVCICKYLALK
jgi:hypothetical protein